MLVTLVVAALVSAGIGVDLAARRSKLTTERAALLVLGYCPLLAAVFVAGSVLPAPESLLPIGAALLVGCGHITGQCGYARTGLGLQALAGVVVKVAALTFVDDEETARTAVLLAAVAVLELAFVAPTDLARL